MAIHGTAARALSLNPPPPNARFREDVLAGLAKPRKELPCKYLYDARGSQLFDAICELPEYYPTRTEVAILREHAHEMADALGRGCLVIEYGSGSSAKTPLLLERLRDPAGYVPVDISRDHLFASAAAVARRFPGLQVRPVWADFTGPFEVPDLPAERRCVFFPGSTIGNFGPSEATALLRGMADHCGRGGAVLIGVDLRKAREILEPAYDDEAGVTAEFNRNLLRRINRELGADFNVDQFDHRAPFNDQDGRIEMYLVSRRPQSVRVGGNTFRFARGESICTEHSYKYTRDAFREMALEAGLEVRQVWVDEQELFSVQYLDVTR
jgi:dimethylhistidine N-methyltransferase